MMVTMRSKLKQDRNIVNAGRSLRSFRNKIRDWLIYDLGFKLVQKYERLIPSYSLIGNTPFIDASELPWTKDLETNWRVIRQELDEIIKHAAQLPSFQDISPDQAYNISKDSLWKTYFLYGYGIKTTENCLRCPETTRLIEQIPGMKTAFFSILLPGKHIPEHRGPYKGVVRCLLGLKIPEPKEKCRLRVADEIRHWEEGKAMIFDDSFPHEAWNETEGIRVVLFLDVLRPLRFPLSLINNLLLKAIAASPFVRDAVNNQKKWNQRLRELYDR